MGIHKTSLQFIISFLFLILPLSIFGLDPLLIEIKIRGIEHSGAPERIGLQLLFTYQPDRPVRTVGLRFAHENYSVFHIYSRNEHGIFLYFYDIPEDLSVITYRISVNGLWMSDPSNPNQKQDASGLSFSIVALDKTESRSITNPVITPDGEVSFAFKTLPGRIIAISGDFNNWDPYSDILTETQPGKYSITLNMLPGRHFYSFIVGGDRVIDPFNLDSAMDYEGYRVSTFVLPSIKSH